MKKILILIIIPFLSLQLFSQEKPKLVVGIVVDQMRYDYIYRFWNDFSEDGFKKLINVRDIAPTISTLLGIAYPNGCTGNPLPEITE